MAGIIASSPSALLLAGDTSADKSSSGWITNEQITLGVTPTGTNYLWSQSLPSAASRTRCALSSTTSATPTFTADVGGTYVLTVVVDSTTEYVLTLTVQSVSISEPVEAVRFSPRTDASIPAPSAGQTMYYSSTQDALVVKDAAGDVFTVTLVAV